MGKIQRGRTADSRLASVRRAERATDSGAFERCGRDQGRAAAGRAAVLRHDSRLRNRPADRHRAAGRKSRACCGRSRIGRPSSIGSLAMGQEVSVTPIQIISAISAVANGGTLYRPHIVREMRRRRCPSPAHPAPDPRKRPTSKTAAKMREMMEDVVLEGTGKPAQLDGYTAAGKSGTAQKIDPATGRYSATQYNSSFVGFAPVNDPAIYDSGGARFAGGSASRRRSRRAGVQAHRRTGAGVSGGAARRSGAFGCRNCEKLASAAPHAAANQRMLADSGKAQF